MASPNIKSKHSIVCNYKQLSWTEEPIAVSRSLPTKYHTAVTERRFSGDIEGFGVATYVMTYYGPPAEKFMGQCTFAVRRRHGPWQRGTVAVNIKGTYDKGPTKVEWLISPETATGELEGLTGFGGYEVNLLCDARVEVHLEVEL